MKVLASMLNFLHYLEVTNNQLYERFGLRPETLTKISKGEPLARGVERYLGAMVFELDVMMQDAEREGRDADKQEIQEFLAAQMITLHGNIEI